MATKSRKPAHAPRIADALVYEYKDQLFVLHRSQQGEGPSAGLSAHQLPSETTGLTAQLALDTSATVLGDAVLQALEAFDSIRPTHEPWELAKLNRNLCRWTTARTINDLTRNSRLVQICQKSGGPIEVIPFDNHSTNPWYGPMLPVFGHKRAIIRLSASPSGRHLGQAIRKAFAKATVHPQRSAK